MAVKYKGNKNRKFTEKETTMQVLNYDESICIVFSNMPRTAAREIGLDLVSAMICRDFALEWNGETLPVPPGSAMLLTFPEKHRYFLPEDSDHWEVLYVSFGGPGAVEIIRSLREQSGPVIALSPTGKTVSTMRSFRHTDPPSSAWAAADMGYHLLMLLADELACRLQGENRSFLKPVLDYCRSHLNGDLSVDALAEISGYSRWHFSRAFKKIQGVSVPQYVLELRLKQAEELLQFTQYSIKEIAEMCGFRNTAYFIRCFSNTFGVTPGIFRKQT